MKRDPKNKLDHSSSKGNVIAFEGKTKGTGGHMTDDVDVLMQDEMELGASHATLPASKPSRGFRFHMGRYRVFGHYVHASFLLLAFLEFVVFVGSVYLAASVGGHSIVELPLEVSLPRAALSALLLVICLATMGLYATHQRERLEGLLLRLSVSFCLWMGVLAILFSAVPGMFVWKDALSTMVVICVLSTLVLRAGFVNFLEQNVAFKRVIVLGVEKNARQIERLRRKADRRGFDLVGYVNPSVDNQPLVNPEKVLQVKGGLCRFVQDQQVDEIVIALESRQQHLISNELLNCRMSGVGIVKLVDFLEREAGRIEVELLQPSWLLHAEGFRFSAVRAISKRISDIVFSVLMLIITFPFILIAALVIWLDCGGKGSVLYRQQRVGQNGRVFNLYKFRSMRTDAEQDGRARWAAKNDPRITRSGAFLRKYRIDEIPQLWNILMGHMSLIGPRPERPQFVESLNALTPFYNERHRVKPGLAGWAQLRYPYGASEEDSIEKLKFDLYYVKNNNLLFDILILIQTLEVVLFGRGAR